ncbi:NADH:flavin oxidoreductase [Proteobacteria bacterium 005FR1]|nr:NADH:flavin oxidoreductase [Proteobacteria bacterium 005FR1]
MAHNSQSKPSSPFSPLQIGPLTLRNRVIKAATNEGMAKGGVPSKQLVKFHESMAAGGVGLTTVAYCAVSMDGRTFVDQAVLDEKTVPLLKAVTDAVHQEGGAVSAQITHGGCFTFLPELSTKYPKSASGGFNKVGVMSGRFFKTQMTEEDMERVAGEFERGAKLAREAGFDAVELHMGHGYLLSQFISPLYNKRKDQYGGSIENRVRFPRQVLRRVLDAVGKDMAVICKFSITEGVKGGHTAEDAAEIARLLEKEGAHLLVLSAGMNVESITTMFGSSFPKENRANVSNPIVKLGMFIQGLTEKPIEFKEMYLLEHARKIRAAVNMPLAYLGGVKSADSIERAMAEGFDAVAIGRALIFDPNMVNEMQKGAVRESGCTSCNRCVSMMYTPGGTSCVLGQPGDAKLNSTPANA